jgi:type I restriction enzyme S subunit
MIGSELPKGWKLTKLGNILCRMTNGLNIEQTDVCSIDSFPISRIETIANEKIDFSRVKYCTPSIDQKQKYLLEDGDILFSHINSDKHLGKTAIYKDIEPLIHGVNLLLLRCNSELYNSGMLNYLLRYYRYTGVFMGIAQRAVNQSSINQKKLSNLDIPLPSLTEQKQIAEKLDKLFDQIETIKEASNKIPELLKNFRQQVLTYAVTGKLIESTPEPRMLGELIDELKYGTSKKADYDIEGFPVLRIPNINNGEIDSSDLKYVPLDDKEYNQLSLQEGDILVIRSNGSLSIVGQCAIVRKECENWVYAGYLIRIRCTHELLPEYLNYIFQSYQVRKQIVEKSHSMSGVNNFSADKIKQLEIAWYPVEVQKQIVEKLNSIFGKLNEIEKQYNTLSEKLDKLPQTLLCKAFKGELNR